MTIAEPEENGTDSPPPETARVLSPDNPFPLAVPRLEKSALQRPVTKAQCVDIATRITYRMCQELFEALDTKHAQAVADVQQRHTEEMQALQTALDDLRGYSVVLLR